MVVLPRYPDSAGGLQEPAKDAAHVEAVEEVRRAGQERVHLFDLENAAGTPIYVHAKVCVIDDVWAAVGSANLNRRSWTHDSALTAAVVTSPVDGDGSEQADSFARRRRLQLWAEHLGRRHHHVEDLIDPVAGIRMLRTSADQLEAWHRAGRTGPHPAVNCAPTGYRRQPGDEPRSTTTGKDRDRPGRPPQELTYAWRMVRRWEPQLLLQRRLQ